MHYHYHCLAARPGGDPPAAPPPTSEAPLERQTRQRAALRLVFQEAGRPLSAAEAHRLAARRVRGIGIATVYRNINRLLADRLLAAVDLPGHPPRYELPGGGHHHHFLCLRCDRLYDVGGCPPSLRRGLRNGFRVDGHEVVLYGTCAACAGSPRRAADD